MRSLTIVIQPGTGTDTCSVCHGEMESADGLRLYAETLGVVCPCCARPHAPELVALLNLACTAEKVGRIGRHNNVFPPLTSLLELARAAENYLASARPPRPQPAPAEKVA